MLDAAATPWNRNETITHKSCPIPEEMLAAPPRMVGSNGCFVSIMIVLCAAIGMKYRAPAASASTTISPADETNVIPKPAKI